MPSIWSQTGQRAYDPCSGVRHSHPSAPAPPLATVLQNPDATSPVWLPMRRLAGLALLFLALLSSSKAEAQQPGQRVVRQLSFEGNRAIADEVLAAAIVTTNSSWFARAFFFRWLGLGAKRYFDEEEFRRDVVRLGVLYKRSGYPDAVIDTVVRRAPQDVYITFKIHEGDPIRVTTLTITGLDSVRPRARKGVLLDLPLQVGDPFNRFAMQATADSITRRLRDRGYPSARVFTAFEADKEAKTAAVTLEADPDG